MPVVILGGKVTVVHLEGGGSWPDRSRMIQVGAVRLPDGGLSAGEPPLRKQGNILGGYKHLLSA